MDYIRRTVFDRWLQSSCQISKIVANLVANPTLTRNVICMNFNDYVRI